MDTTTTTTTRIFPGLIDSNLEIFKTSDGLKIMNNGHVQCFSKMPKRLYALLKTEMKRSSAYAVLKKWHPKNEEKQVEKFAECRLGGLDFTPDISESKLQHGEYWDCPLRGNCDGEGIVCKKLTYNGNKLEAIDIKLLQLISNTSYTNEVLALELDVPLGTLHKLKKELYNKLHIQTKQEATLIAATVLNIV